QQAQVVHEEGDGVEPAERGVHLVEAEHPGSLDAALACDADGERRDVDADDVVSAPLELEGDTAGADADVEHAAADVPERLALDRSPAPGPVEVGVRRLAVDEAVVSLDDQASREPVRVGEQGTAEGVLLGNQAQACAAGAATSACARSSIRSSTDSMPTERRTRLRGAAKGALAVDACVIRAGTSIRLSTPPRLSARSHSFVRATRATASSSVAARNETMPPKSRIWRAAIACPGWSGRPG